MGGQQRSTKEGMLGLGERRSARRGEACSTKDSDAKGERTGSLSGMEMGVASR